MCLMFFIGKFSCFWKILLSLTYNLLTGLEDGLDPCWWKMVDNFLMFSERNTLKGLICLIHLLVLRKSLKIIGNAIVN